MKLSLEYEAKDGYLYVKASGAFEINAARSALTQWTAEARRVGLDRVLCDITRMKGLNTGDSSVMARFDINTLVADSARGIRLAVLATPEQLSHDRFEENVMVNRGAVAKVTSCLSEALEWLETDPSD